MNEPIAPVSQPSSPAATDMVARASLILLTFDPGRQAIMAELEPSPDASAATLESLRALLAADGFAEFYTNDEVLRPVVLAANKAQAGRYPVAERRDAKLDLKVSADKMTVQASLTKAWGGKRLTGEELSAALKSLGIPQRCLQADAMAQLLVTNEDQQRVVAQAILPEKGQDARFEVLVDACKALALQEDEHGRVDFYQSHEFVVIDPDTPLMRRIPPTQGKLGIDVQGSVLSPEPGKDQSFNRDILGAHISPGDPNLLLASIKGHPVVVNAGVNVDPTLRVKSVNLATGNISFDGSVEVAGDVASGLSVQATGDVFINGIVEKARVTARRNLVIKGGVVGEDLGRDENNQLILRTRLRAGGNIHAKFINLAEVIAGQDIHVREYVMQSHLRAQGAVLLGQDGGKGSLIGGRVQAGEKIVVNTLGSEAYVATEVRVGTDNVKRRWLDALKQAYKKTQHNIAQLQPLLTAQGNPAADKLARLQLTLTALEERLLRIRRIVERLLARQRATQTRQIDIKRGLYANVTLSIDGATQISDSDTGPRCLIRSGVDLVVKG